MAMRRRSRSRRKRPAVMLLALLALAAGGVWHLTVGGDSAPGRQTAAADMEEEPPLLEAEVIKFAPDDPGGMDIPHQDKSVYTRLTTPGAASAGKGAGDGDGAQTEAQADAQAHYVVQLASFSRRAEARDALTRLRTRFPSLLAAAALHIQSADLGEKGAEHRVRAGAFAVREEARKLCLALRAHGQDCLVTVR